VETSTGNPRAFLIANTPAPSTPAPDKNDELKSSPSPTREETTVLLTAGYCCSKIDTVSSVRFATARSSLPSPLKSAAASLCL
jgi:hypothetical protein